jgi:N-acetylglutamate synthase-like GNAT family acetyltransferase
MKEIILTSGASLQHALDFLKENKLPYQDIDTKKTTLISYEGDEGTFIGTGGLEFYGTYALLRSVAVQPALRGKMLGQQIVADLIERAKERSVHRIYLLTETAQKYFLSLGFRNTSRDEVPHEVKQSSEFNHVCPASAACMVYDVNEAIPARLVFHTPVLAMIQKLSKDFDQISAGRKNQLSVLTEYIANKLRQGHGVDLNFICTHNSRRSHLAQVWSQTAAYYYGVYNVRSFSGGTEVTTINPRAVQALRQAGFEITNTVEGENPVYEISFSPERGSVKSFSKKYNDDANPVGEFAAVMTCSDADENCPVISGAEKRISLPYDDPKTFDGTELEDQKYTERLHEIGRDLLFCFSEVQNKLKARKH